ncbi:MAG: tetratricopeptide repeat protein [Candidatus Schekmanbacteria bacterium]|nr:MAG: tetratricopeptide repeat protein [Candidatus Schekmanbacteria bacterium]
MAKKENKNGNKKTKLPIFLLLIIAMVIIIPLITSNLTLNPFNAVKTLAYRISLIIFISIYLIKKAFSRETVIYNSPLLIPLSIFIIIALFSAVNMTNKYVFFDALSELILSAIFSFIIIQELKNEDFKIIAIVSSIVGTLVSSIAIYQYFTAESFNLANSVRSTLGHSNFLAHYLIIIIPLTLSLILSSLKKIYMALYSIFFIIQITALAVTFARGGWIACIISTIIFAFLSTNISVKNKSLIIKRIIAVLIITILITGGIAATKPHVLEALFIPFKEMKKVASGEESEFKYKIITILVRLEMWKGTIDMIKSNPIFGVGLGNYWIVAQKYRTPNELKMDYDMLKWAHNDILQIGAETGFFGMIAFIFLLYSIFKTSYKKIIEYEGEKKIILAGFICALAATVIHSQVSFNFFKTVPIMYFWITAAFLSGKGKKEFKISLPQRNFVKVLVTLVFVAFSIAGIYIYSSQFIGEAYFSKSERYSMKKEWEKSIPLLKKALSFSPNNAKFRYALALSYFKTGNFKDSIKQCNKALSLTPYVSDINRLLGYAYNELGNVYFAKKKYSKALNEYNKVIEISLARMQLKLRPHEVGILVNELANAYYNRGNLYKLIGDYIKAKEDYEEALHYNPQHYLASKGLARINLLLKTAERPQPE